MLGLVEINSLKEDGDKLLHFVRSETNGSLIRVLEKLGRLPENFDERALHHLLNNNSSKVRVLAIKNLAKLSDIKLLNDFVEIIKNDTSTEVRREAASAIGRMRDEETIPFQEGLLQDGDPEVVLQAIRGLMVFKDNTEVKEKLKELKTHSNEIIKEVIKKEFKEKQPKSDNMKHTESPDFMKNAIVRGDVREVLKHVPDESVHLTFTSPPYYNARDYSIYPSYEKYLNFLEEVFKEVYRITKEGRFFILNTSPIIIPRVSRQHSSKRYPIPYDIHPLLVKMGWEFIDDIIWVKPEASVKNRVGGFLQHRKPLGYKPNACTESVMVYRKKTDKLLDWNIRSYDRKTVEESKVNEDFESTNIWKIDPTFDKTHSAVFPIELCNKIIKYYSFVGDLVFDPFGGSGTFGKSASNLNRFFFLTEKEAKYVERIKENVAQNMRLDQNYKKPKFFDIDTFASEAKK